MAFKVALREYQRKPIVKKFGSLRFFIDSSSTYPKEGVGFPDELLEFALKDDSVVVLNTDNTIRIKPTIGRSLPKEVVHEPAVVEKSFADKVRSMSRDEVVETLSINGMKFDGRSSLDKLKSGLIDYQAKIEKQKGK